MTAHNSEQYLAEALDSIYAQRTGCSWELIFVDDGSTDRTLRIAREFAARPFSRMQVLQHPRGKNRGISASRSLAFRQVRGEFLAFLDSDDVWLPTHLETQVPLLRKMPEVAMVYAGAERWFDFEQPFSGDSRTADWGHNCLPPLLPAGQSAGLLPRGELLAWFRKDESLVPCICTVVLRTEVARGVGGFCDQFRGVYDDQAFHAKVLLRHDVFANDVCTARYRQHADSCCHRASRTTKLRRKEEHRFQSFLQSYIDTLDSSQFTS